MNRMHNAAATALVAISVAAVTVNAQPRGSQADTAQLTTLSCEMGRAYARQDLAALDGLSAEDYTQTDTRGVVVAHADYSEYLRQRFAAFAKNATSKLTIDCDNIEVRVYGDAALVTGGWTYIVHKAEGDTNRRSRWTSMWTRYPTGWKRHAFQNTWVNPDANRPVPCAGSSSEATNRQSGDSGAKQ
jgi:ketosteroid isomerase-like protein